MSIYSGGLEVERTPVQPGKSLKPGIVPVRAACWVCAIFILAALSFPAWIYAQQSQQLQAQQSPSQSQSKSPSQQPQQSQSPSKTSEEIYVVNHVDVTPENAEAASKLLQQYAADTRKEKGALRVEAAVQISRPNHFVVTELWQNQQAYDAHVSAAHTKAFREKIQPMLGSPFDERLHQIIG